MNATCAQCRQLCSDLYDDALPPAARSAALAHLSSCAACRKEYRQLQTALGAVAQLGEEHTGPAFDRVVMRRVQRLAERERFFGWGRPMLWRRGALVTMLLALCLGSLGFGFALRSLWMAPSSSGSTPENRQGVADRDGGDGAETQPDEAPRGDETERGDEAERDPAPVEPDGAVDWGTLAQDEEFRDQVLPGLLEELGFVRVGDEQWASATEARLREQGGGILDGDLLTVEQLVAHLRPRIAAELEDAASEALADGEEREPTPTELLARLGDDELRALAELYLPDMGFQRNGDQWLSETEARLLDPNIVCIDQQIMTRSMLKEHLRDEILADAGLTREGQGNWLEPQLAETDDGDERDLALERGDRFWAPPIGEVMAAAGESEAMEPEGIAALIQDLGSSRSRRQAKAFDALRETSPAVVQRLEVAHRDAKREDEKLAYAKSLAWFGVETPTIVSWVDQLAEHYETARHGLRAGRYQQVVLALEEAGLMAGRVLERRFVEQPNLRTAELLSLFGHPEAEVFLIDAYLGRPGTPVEAQRDVHGELLEWWLRRRASGDPTVFDRAVALLNRSDERARLVAVHLLEAIAYRHPEWASRVSEELLSGAEGSFCGCSLSPAFGSARAAQLADCRLHVHVAVEDVLTGTRWMRSADLKARNRARSSRGAVVAADIGRVLSNLSGDKYFLTLSGAITDEASQRDEQKLAVKDWRIRFQQHRDSYVLRWRRMAPLAERFRASELEAPWHLRNALARERTDLRGNFYAPEQGLAGVVARRSDGMDLNEVLKRHLGVLRADIIDGSESVVPFAGAVVSRLPRSVRTRFEFYALSVGVLDGLNLALQPRGLTLAFEAGKLTIVDQ